MMRMLHTCMICNTMLLLDDYYFWLELIGHIPYCKTTLTQDGRS